MSDTLKNLEKRRRMGLPLNLTIHTTCGKVLVFKRGVGETMIARQKAPGPPLNPGDEFYSKTGAGPKHLYWYRVEKRKGKSKDLVLSCLGKVREEAVT